MNTWLVLPSKRPATEAADILAAWRTRGYGIAIQRDTGDGDVVNSIVCYERPYRGYAEAVNFLAAEVLKTHPDCDWIVAAGDDTLPDRNKRADEIAAECSAHFAGTFGVCQPTGDDWSDNGPRGDKTGELRLIRRVAGSPWLGREWCLRANKGKGPLWPAFYHMFADETLQCVAEKLGVFWQRDDLTHHHQHWGRPKPGERIGKIENMPEFLTQANSPEEWKKSKAEFERLKAGGFEECLPL